MGLGLKIARTTTSQLLAASGQTSFFEVWTGFSEVLQFQDHRIIDAPFLQVEAPFVTVNPNFVVADSPISVGWILMFDQSPCFDVRVPFRCCLNYKHSPTETRYFQWSTSIFDVVFIPKLSCPQIRGTSTVPSKAMVFSLQKHDPF